MNATMRLGLSSVLLICAGGLAAYAPAASAQVAPLKNKATGRCLAVDATGFAIAQACNGTAAIQKWSQIDTGSGVLIKNNFTGRCLDGDPSAFALVFSSACNPAIASQRWIRLNTGVGTTTARYKSSVTGWFLENQGPRAVFSGVISADLSQIWSF
jgi:hypothetical protein